MPKTTDRPKTMDQLCDELLQEEHTAEQWLSQRTNSADAVRTPSDSSEDGESRVASLQPATLWWAKLLRKHKKPDRNTQHRAKPVTVVSGCTGAAAEIAVLKARP